MSRPGDTQLWNDVIETVFQVSTQQLPTNLATAAILRIFNRHLDNIEAGRMIAIPATSSPPLDVFYCEACPRPSQCSMSGKCLNSRAIESKIVLTKTEALVPLRDDPDMSVQQIIWNVRYGDGDVREAADRICDAVDQRRQWERDQAWNEALEAAIVAIETRLRDLPSGKKCNCERCDECMGAVSRVRALKRPDPPEIAYYTHIDNCADGCMRAEPNKCPFGKQLLMDLLAARGRPII